MGRNGFYFSPSPISKFKSIPLFFFSSPFDPIPIPVSRLEFPISRSLKLVSQIGQLFNSRSLSVPGNW